MPLFQSKILSRSISELHIPDAHKTILQKWVDSIESRSIYSQNEVALHGHFIHEILIGVLGYQGFGESDQWDLQREQKIGRGNVDVALGRFSETEAQIIAPFELKGANTKDLDAIMSGRHKSPVQQAWEYAMDAPGAKWVLLSNYVEVRLYAVGYGRQDYETWQFTDLLDPHEYARFMLLLSAKNLLRTETRSLLEASEKAEKDITSRLYEDYRNLRFHLIDSLQHDNPNTSSLTLVGHAQTLLDRILFIAFAEDRGLLPEQTLQKAYQHNDPYNQKPIWENFKGLFQAINQGNKTLDIPAYNGGLFSPDPAIDQLVISDDLCEKFKALGEYDFESEVGVTVLGHIFEQSISDLETIHETIEAGTTPTQLIEKQTAVKGKRKQHGVVYTPDNITQFIVEKTLGSYLKNAFDQLLIQYTKKQSFEESDQKIRWKNKSSEQQFWISWRDTLMQIRILDPACGSGAFLVAAFDYLYAEYTRVNDKLADITGSRDLFDLDKEILNNNLYGVDLNEESIEITKLSLWLKTAHKGKPLTSLDDNLKHGNSLINDRQIDHHAFNWQQQFPAVFATGGFDVVLGNPPYVRQERISEIKPWLEQNYTVYHGVADLYCYFFELGMRVLKPDGLLGYISSSTFFKTSSGKNLRTFLSQQTTLEVLINFNDLQLFEGVTTYPAIIIARNQTANPNSNISFLSLQNQLPEDLHSHFQQSQRVMQQQQLQQQSWRLEEHQLAELRSKITQGKPTLKEVYGSPKYGVKTGLNEAFVIDRKTRDQLVREDPNSTEIVKPLIKGNEIRKWHFDNQGNFLILFPKGWTTSKFGNIDEDKAFSELLQLYPAICNWLIPFSAKGKRRSDKGEFWWELRSCDYYHMFEEPKISYIEICSTNPFCYDKSGIYQEATTFFLPNAELELLAILNSSLAWFHFSSVTTILRGGYLRMKNQFIEPFPIPTATDQQKQTLAELAESCQHFAEQRYAIQKAVRQRIPDLCPSDREAKLSKKLIEWWALDFALFRREIKKQFKQDIPLQDRNDWESWLNVETEKIEQLSVQIAQAEQQINSLVYDLFDLSKTEIMLLEDNL